MNAKLLILIAILFAPLHINAQGFAGLANDAEGFADVTLNTSLTFPADHGAHPDFRIEWWYLTANLIGPDQTPYGVQWTLFRQATQPGRTGEGWENAQIWMGHAALTTPNQHYVGETFARGGIGQADVTAEPFQAYIDDWNMQAIGDDLAQMSLSASGLDFSYDLDLQAKGPLVLHGDAGYSVKSASGQASRYYSQPFYEVSGHVTTGDGAVPVTGKAWLDREWSSQPLDQDQTGWDWFSLHFSGGSKLMAARVRGQSDFTFGTWIEADGTSTPIPNQALSLTALEHSDVLGRDIPTTWRVELPERGVDIEVSAVNANSYMTTLFPYWEGPVRVTGSHTGVGYLEMTGY